MKSKKGKTVRPGREILLTRAGITVTLLAVFLFVTDIFKIVSGEVRSHNWWQVAGDIIFTAIVLYLIFGGLVYLFTRAAYFSRLKKHSPAAMDELERLLDAHSPHLTILVPSYKEDARVVNQTLMSAALQNYPNKRVVLLIDDPPSPANPRDIEKLKAVRALPRRLQHLFREPAERFHGALRDFMDRSRETCVNYLQETAMLAGCYSEAADWYDKQAQAYVITNHTDALFREKILVSPRDIYRAKARELRDGLQKRGRGLTTQQILHGYRKLAAPFTVDLTSFERKRYVNLSHEPNKAMNLNSYIALTGKRYTERKGKQGLYLLETNGPDADFQIPEPDYFITLDADSLLSHDYALRLISMMEQPGNERVAIVQTPYSAVPGARSLERIAGATTDIQYIIHQGFTRHNATYWVGANALLRKSALDDIAFTDTERGFPIKKYIQDRTVIEDTESTVDLIHRGWTLYNYPERLSYSATPPDFGSLIIQRSRWANGGLIILPKFLKYIMRGPHVPGKLMEGPLRFHYLTSLAVMNLGFVVLMSVPFAENIFNIWLPLTALPYFVLYARDLGQTGYRVSDLFRVYALNLLLIPVHLAGVFKSIRQMLKGTKTPFGRTPKIKERTTTALSYIIVEYIMLAHWTVGSTVDFARGYLLHGVFAVVNAAFLFYAIASFVGLAESRKDFTVGLERWRRKPAALERPATAACTPRVRTLPADDVRGLSILKIQPRAARLTHSQIREYTRLRDKELIAQSTDKS